MRRLLGALGACALATCALAGPPAATVDQLVTKLGSESFADREAATTALLAAGPSAIPALEAAAAGDDPEVARRAGLVLAKLRARRDDPLLTPKPVRLDSRNTPLAAAVDDLKARTGLNLVLDREQVADPARPVTCVTGELPPWEAVAAFCRAAGLREVFHHELPLPDTGRTYQPPPPPAEDVPVVLADGPVVDLPGNRATAVRVLVLPPAFPGHRVVLGTGDTTLCFDVTPTPGLHWQDWPAVRVTRVIDDAGRAGGAGLPAPRVRPELFDPDRALAWRVNRTDSFERQPRRVADPNPRVVPVPLKLATPSARSLRALDGAVVGTVIVPGQPLATIDRPAANLGRAVEGVGGLRATVVRVEAITGHDRTRVWVKLESTSPWVGRAPRDGIGLLEPAAPRPEGMTPRLTALDAAGLPVPPVASDLLDVQDDGARTATLHEYQFAGGVPARLVVVGPRAAVVEVPFALADVPLP